VILCVGPNDKIQVITSIGRLFDVHVSGVDADSSSPSVMTMYRKNTAITTAATTDITAAPASGHVLNVKTINFFNKDTGPINITVQHTDGTTISVLWKGTISAFQGLSYVEGAGWNLMNPTMFINRNRSLAQQGGTTFTTETYLAGSDVIIPSPINPGVYYRAVIDTGKSSGGSVATTVNVKIGSGVIGDTTRLAFAWAAGTGVADTGVMTVEAMFRAGGASGTIQGRARWVTNLTNTGWTVSDKAKLVTSGAFDMTTIVGQRIGISLDPQGNFTTVQLVEADLVM
jgi:hypothetical protein